jgi:hypothetical protein
MFKILLKMSMDEKIKIFHTNKCGEHGIHFEEFKLFW